MYLQYNDNNGRRNMGLTIADRIDTDIYDLVAERDSIMKAIPRGAGTRTRRCRSGRSRAMACRSSRSACTSAATSSKAALVNLSDRNGKPRLRLMVDSLGTPSLEFLDAAGNGDVALAGE